MELDCKDQVAALAVQKLKNLSKTRQREPERWKLALARAVKLFILNKQISVTLKEQINYPQKLNKTLN